jgi:oxygen-independent coproporphyrinogen-3 oxidase
MTSNLAIYVHWPYCQSKCPYCDFNSFVGSVVDHAAWRSTYQQELASWAARQPGRRVTSIFFGGGTPSLMEPQTVATVLDTIHRHWSVADDVEITLEANPTSVEADKFAVFRSAGVNRLSLGVQSLRDDALKFLGRAHDAQQAMTALELASKFPRYSFDLIYARHGQTPEAWEAELRQALAFGSKHLSLYQLTIELNTQFYTLAQRQVPLTAPDDASVAMFEMTQAIMAAAGRPAYEISNYATAGEASRHNLTYWHYQDYLGIGPGAHGRVAGMATENHRAPDVWLRQVVVQGNGLRVDEPVPPDIAQREALMMGLRLTEGINLTDWQQKFGQPLTSLVPATKITRLRTEGFLTTNESYLQATAAGLQRLNAVLGYLL